MRHSALSGSFLFGVFSPLVGVVLLLAAGFAPRAFAQAKLVDLTVVSVSDCDARGFVEVVADVTLERFPVGDRFGIQFEHAMDTLLVYTGNPTRVTTPALANIAVQDVDLFGVTSPTSLSTDTNIPLAVCSTACRLDSVRVVEFGPCDAGFVDMILEIDYTNSNGAALIDLFYSGGGVAGRKIFPVTGGPQRVSIPIRAAGQPLPSTIVAVGMDGCLVRFPPLQGTAPECPEGCGIRDVALVSVSPCNSSGEVEVVVEVDFVEPLPVVRPMFGNQTAPPGFTSPVLFTNRYPAAGQLVMEQVSLPGLTEFLECSPEVWSMTLPDCRCDWEGIEVLGMTCLSNGLAEVELAFSLTNALAAVLDFTVNDVPYRRSGGLVSPVVETVYLPASGQALAVSAAIGQAALGAECSLTRTNLATLPDCSVPCGVTAVTLPGFGNCDFDPEVPLEIRIEGDAPLGARFVVALNHVAAHALDPVEVLAPVGEILVPRMVFQSDTNGIAPLIADVGVEVTDPNGRSWVVCSDLVNVMDLPPGCLTACEQATAITGMRVDPQTGEVSLFIDDGAIFLPSAVEETVDLDVVWAMESSTYIASQTNSPPGRAVAPGSPATRFFRMRCE